MTLAAHAPAWPAWASPEAAAEAHPHLEAGDWRQAVHRRAAGRLSRLAWPTRRHEAWKYTDLAPLAARGYRLVAPPEASAVQAVVAALAKLPALGPRLVFINGHVSLELSTVTPEDGLRLLPLSRAAAADWERTEAHRTAATGHCFAAMNGAFLQDGALIAIGPGRALAQPVELVFAATGQGHNGAWMAHPRVVVLAEAGCAGQVVEHHLDVDDGDHFCNTVVELWLGEGAQIDHCVLHAASAAASHVRHVQACLGRGARLGSTAVVCGGRLTRHALHAELAGEGATCHASGLSLGRDAAHVDIEALARHAQPHGTSSQLYRGIFADQATGVFYGQVKVSPGAQKTVARQLSQNLLLSPQATVHSRPQLEILADDVKCNHGATVGALDEAALFYLRSRGLAPDAAQRLLTYAFATEALAPIGHPAVRARADQMVRDWLRPVRAPC